MSLPVIPVFVTQALGLNNVWGGLGVGIAFLSTILTRGYAGAVADRRGAKLAAARGLLFYAAGSLISLSVGPLSTSPLAAYGVLLVGRLLLGLGESLVGVGVITWGIGLVGPTRSGKVLALVGTALYGAFAVGGPIGLMLYKQFGFIQTMAISTAVPLIGLLAIWPIAGVAPHPQAHRPPFLRVIGKIWWLGSIVCLQGIGFAAIGAFFALFFLSRSWGYAGLGLTAFGGGFVLVRALFGHLPDRVGGFPVAIGSLAVETVGQVLIWNAGSPAMALSGALLTGLGCSMIFPAMGREVVHLVDPHLRGAALGGFAAFQDLAYGLTGPTAGVLADRAGISSVFLIGATGAALGLLIALQLRRSRRPIPA
jgi:MFS family permease